MSWPRQKAPSLTVIGFFTFKKRAPAGGQRGHKRRMQKLIVYLETNPEKRFVLFSTSAVGYYGFHGDEELTENSPPGDDFLATVTTQWESEALK